MTGNTMELQICAINTLKQNIAAVIQGKDEAIELLLIALFTGGSVLMEDVPGVGKTTLRPAIAII